MAFKRKFLGGYEFSGNMKGWMETFQGWHKQDVGERDISFDRYFAVIFGWYHTVVKDMWVKQGRAHEVKEMNAIEITMQKNPQLRQIAAYDSVDYMAERMDLSDMKLLGPQARAFTKKELGI